MGFLDLVQRRVGVAVEQALAVTMKPGVQKTALHAAVLDVRGYERVFAFAMPSMVRWPLRRIRGRAFMQERTGRPSRITATGAAGALRAEFLGAHPAPSLSAEDVLQCPLRLHHHLM